MGIGENKLSIGFKTAKSHRNLIKNNNKSDDMRFLILLIFFISSFFTYAGNAQPLTIVRGNQSYPPYEIYQPNKTLTGFHIELINAVASDLGIAVEFKSLPWKRSVHMIENGQADAITYFGKTVEREKFAIFKDGNVISHVNNSLFTKKENCTQVACGSGLSPFSGYTLGKIHGYSYGDLISENHWNKIDDRAKSEVHLIRKLLAGRIDIAIGEKQRIIYLAREEGILEQLFFIEPELQSIPQYLAFSKKSPNHHWAERFSKAMQAFIKTKTYQNIKQKYHIEAD